MKKPLFFALLTVLFCALFAVSLAACSDDKAPEPAPNAPNPESPKQDVGNPDDPKTPDTKTTYIVEAEETRSEKFAAPYDASFEFLPQNAEIAKESDVYTYNGNTVLVAVAGETFIPEGTGKSLAALAEENSEDFIFDAGENKKNDYSKFIAAYAENCNENGLHVLTDEMKTLLDLYAAAKELNPLFACGVYTEDNPDLTTGEGSASSPYTISAENYRVKVAAGRTLYFSAEELLMITSGDDIVTMTYEEKTYTAGNIEFDCAAGGVFIVNVPDGSEETITFTAKEIKVKDSRNTSSDPDENEKKKTYSAGSQEELVGEYGVYINKDNFRIKFTNTTGASINIKITRKTENVKIRAVWDELFEDEMPEDSNVLEFTLEADIECWIDIETSENLFARFSIEIVETQE